MEDSNPRLARRLAALIAVAITLALLLTPLPVGWLGVWQGKFLDFGHVPLFACLVLALRAGIGPPTGLALVAAILLAGCAEIVQPLVGRTGDWGDFLRGCLGALAAGAAIRARECRHRAGRVVYAALALALLGWPVAEVGPFVADAVEGHRAFPVLADFSTRRELLRWHCVQATLSPDPEGARLDLLPGPGEYSSGEMSPAVADFRGYRWLCCEFRVVGDPLELVISVRTRAREAGGTTHAQVDQSYPEGRRVVRLDLAAMAARARPEPLDLSDVRSVQFFVVRAREARTVLLSRIWLEP
jgi:hypothetical protein